MITDQETLALLSEIQRIQLEVRITEPEKALVRLKELLAQTPLPYRLIIERIYLDGFNIKDTIDKIKARSDPAVGPKNLQDAFWAWLQRLPRKFRYPLFVLMFLAGALFAVWKSLPAPVQSEIIELLFSPRLLVTIETAGPVQSLPGGEYVFPLALRVENRSDAPVHMEPGMLILGDHSEPCLAGLVLFKTSTVGAHTFRHESLSVKLILLRPEALPTKTGEKIPAGWLRLSDVGARGREETLTRELDPKWLQWGIPGATAAP